MYLWYSVYFVSFDVWLSIIVESRRLPETFNNPQLIFASNSASAMFPMWVPILISKWRGSLWMKLVNASPLNDLPFVKCYPFNAWSTELMIHLQVPIRWYIDRSQWLIPKSHPDIALVKFMDWVCPSIIYQCFCVQIPSGHCPAWLVLTNLLVTNKCHIVAGRAILWIGMTFGVVILN